MYHLLTTRIKQEPENYVINVADSVRARHSHTALPVAGRQTTTFCTVITVFTCGYYNTSDGIINILSRNLGSIYVSYCDQSTEKTVAGALSVAGAGVLFIANLPRTSSHNTRRNEAKKTDLDLDIIRGTLISDLSLIHI